MLHGGLRTADVARAINCNVRTARRLRQCYRETGRRADRPCSGRPSVTTPAQDQYIRISHLQDRYRMATTTARVTPGMHNPSISARIVCSRLREAGLRACGPVVRQVLTRQQQQQQRRLWAQTHLRWTRQDSSSLMRCGFVSPGVMVRLVFIIEGMSVTLRPALWSGIDLEVEGPSWSGAVCHSIIGLSLLSLQCSAMASEDPGSQSH
ncbi:uncharacterized protein LOC127412899 [Myxocyprinus asiaticus]|uniref:uncharacterized protein LOC127412899 n=1 Tax=Myxocyprinus asiaticus TaxID=70543 RepID=UPI0022218918|nr:uncharacterized protein LOC127412899 [Myxocyprinus asiaticus]